MKQIQEKVEFLHDDGKGFDSDKNDNVYTALINPPTCPEELRGDNGNCETKMIVLYCVDLLQI